MSDLGMRFVVHARRVRLVDETPPPAPPHQKSIDGEGSQENVFWKMCTDCLEIMPHYRRDDHSECSVCGLRTFPRRQMDVDHE